MTTAATASTAECRARAGRIRHVSALLACWLLAAAGIPGAAQAQAFNCAAAAFYQVRAGGGGSILSTVDRTTAPYALAPLYTVPQQVNAMGYNPVDNFLYATTSTSRQLVRLGAGGVALANVAIAGLPTSGTIDAGAFDLGGRYWLAFNNGSVVRITGVGGAAPAPVAATLTLAADPAPRAGYTGVASLLVGDWAINPVESSTTRTVLYGTRSPENGTLYLYRAVIDDAANATQVLVSRRATTGLVTANAFGTIFMDAAGALYAYKNDATAASGFYTVDVATASATSVSGSASTAQSDGAICPLAVAAVPPTLTLDKVTTGGAGGPFAFTLTNTGQPGGTVSTTAAGTPARVDGDTANPGTQPFAVSAFNTAVTITESDPPLGYALTNAACTVANGGAPVAVGSFSAATRTYTIPGTAAVSNAAFACTFTNERRATLRVQKALPGGRVAAGDQFTLTATGTGGPFTATTTGSGVTATGQIAATIVPGSAYTVTETASGSTVLANYGSTYACTNALAGGQTPQGTGSSFSVTPVVGDDLTCTFTNTAAVADLSITKDDGVTSATPGSTVNYAVVVTNNGPAAADGAVVRDPVATGLTCTTATCGNAVNGSACPAATGAALLTALQSAGGVAIPTLPNTGAVTFTVTCTVQ